MSDKSGRNRLIIVVTIISLLSGFLVACGDTATPELANPSPAKITPPATTVAGTTALSTASTTSAATSAAAQAPTTGLPSQPTLATTNATIQKANGEKVTLVVELARTEQEQEIGLMGRTNLPDNRGMLFVYTSPVSLAFWMRNTPSPLSIAFIDEKGKILDIQDMQPLSDDTHSPGKPFLLALEVPLGYFARHGIKPGDIFSY
ncbi:MAG TPA: DUF192 domain-containing protein [Chloroflexia bacterium]|nr:DUF192 domain-containing protein [Chloroflexia bacterium]